MKKNYLIPIFFIFIIFLCFNCTQTVEEKNENPPADYSQEYQAIDTTLSQAFGYYTAQIGLEATADARNDLIDWLKLQSGISDAFLVSDGSSVKVRFNNGAETVFLTELRGKAIPSNYADLYDTYSQQSLSQIDNNQGFSYNPIRAVPSQYASVGVSAIILAPFAWESIADPTKVIETEEIAKYFYDFVLVDNFINTILLYNENVTIDMFAMALIGITGPAEILEINTHGGLDTVNGSEIAFLMTGERVTPSNLGVHWNDLYSTKILTWAYVGGKSFYGITPKFVEQYSGIPDSSNASWLCRYVHINACYSSHLSLSGTFTGHGAICYSGYSGKVTWGYGKTSSIDFFKNLAATMNVENAWDNVTPKNDPIYTNTQFQISGNIENARYFYRTFFTFDGQQMETPSYLWEVVYNEGTAASVYWESITLLSGNNEVATGILNIVISVPSAGDYNAVTEDNVEISFTELATGTVWISKKAEFDAGKPCDGNIHISEFNNTHGGRIVGTFDATLVNSDQTDPPYDHKDITGNFTIIRNLYGGWSSP